MSFPSTDQHDDMNIHNLHVQCPKLFETDGDYKMCTYLTYNLAFTASALATLITPASVPTVSISLLLKEKLKSQKIMTLETNRMIKQFSNLKNIKDHHEN